MLDSQSIFIIIYIVKTTQKFLDFYKMAKKNLLPTLENTAKILIFKNNCFNLRFVSTGHNFQFLNFVDLKLF